MPDEDLERLCAIVSRTLMLVVLDGEAAGLYDTVRRARRDVDGLIAERKLRRMPTNDTKPN